MIFFPLLSQKQRRQVHRLADKANCRNGRYQAGGSIPAGGFHPMSSQKQESKPDFRDLPSASAVIGMGGILSIFYAAVIYE